MRSLESIQLAITELKSFSVKLDAEVKMWKTTFTKWGPMLVLWKKCLIPLKTFLTQTRKKCEKVFHQPESQRSYGIRPPEDERCQCSNTGISHSYESQSRKPDPCGTTWYSPGFRSRETKIQRLWFKIWSSVNTNPTTRYRLSGCIESGRLTNFLNFVCKYFMFHRNKDRQYWCYRYPSLISDTLFGIVYIPPEILNTYQLIV